MPEFQDRIILAAVLKRQSLVVGESTTVLIKLFQLAYFLCVRNSCSLMFFISSCICIYKIFAHEYDTEICKVDIQMTHLLIIIYE